jgi:hypothetical protein
VAILYACLRRGNKGIACSGVPVGGAHLNCALTTLPRTNALRSVRSRGWLAPFLIVPVLVHVPVHDIPFTNLVSPSFHPRKHRHAHAAKSKAAA